MGGWAVTFLNCMHAVNKIRVDKKTSNILDSEQNSPAADRVALHCDILIFCNQFSEMLFNMLSNGYLSPDIN